MTAEPTGMTCPAGPHKFHPRTTGGKPQVYCSTACRHRHREGRTAFTAALEAAGVVSIGEVMAVLDGGGLPERLLRAAADAVWTGRRSSP